MSFKEFNPPAPWGPEACGVSRSVKLGARRDGLRAAAPPSLTPTLGTPSAEQPTERSSPIAAPADHELLRADAGGQAQAAEADGGQHPDAVAVDADVRQALEEGGGHLDAQVPQRRRGSQAAAVRRKRRDADVALQDRRLHQGLREGAAGLLPRPRRPGTRRRRGAAAAGPGAAAGHVWPGSRRSHPGPGGMRGFHFFIFSAEISGQ